MKKIFVLGLAVVLTATCVLPFGYDSRRLESIITRYAQMDDYRIDYIKIIDIKEDENYGGVSVQYYSYDDRGNLLWISDSSLSYMESSVEC